jgi:transcriptional regulator with XRE-family HTH domain
MPGDEERRREVSARIGENVRVLREARGLSQDDLAREMSALGWQYYQSTVYKVEHGERKVSAGELVDLAAVLKTSLDRFTWTSAEANETAMVYDAAATLRGRWEEAAVAVRRLLAARTRGERMLASSGGSTSPRVRAALAELAADLRDRGLDEAVDEGIARYENPEET